ncbi:hypothetical protein CVS40_12962 [Lucilia cuprina]|nr:hypothetical protein CVS40_12962 [Lucilia cuprina]
MFFWSEINGNRGPFEIGSCVLHYIESEIQKESNPEDVEFIFYSDNCAGQQKNKSLISMYSYAVQKYHIKSITHKFLITGHTQNEGDNVHSVIEKQIKRHVTCIPIYIPEQYISLIATAKKTGRPYKLHKLSHNDFYDLKTLQEEWGHNFTTDVEKEKILWKDIEILKVEKNSPESFFYKTSYSDSNFKEVKVRNITTKSLKSWHLIKYNVTLPERKKMTLWI